MDLFKINNLKKIYSLVSQIVPSVYAIGGCVRDSILGIIPADYDFCTPLPPEEIELCIKKAGRKPYLVGKKYGTIGFKVETEPSVWQYVEVTTFRHEQYLNNTRFPTVVYIKDLKSDIQRRDFTINALAWNIEDGLIDYFNGLDDLKNKVIRAVGQPKERFTDDPLRILRAGRFASQLGFTIDSYTQKKSKECSFMLLKVSKERWMLELNKLLLSNNPRVGLEFLMRVRAFNWMIPELALQYNYNQNSKYHDFDLWEHTLRVVENTPKDLILRWSSLFHDSGKPFVATINPKSGVTNYIFHEKVSAEIVLKYAQYLKWPNELRDNVYSIVKYHLKEDSILRPYDLKAHKL